MSPRLPSPQARYVAVNGISLAYLDWPGERGPLICLPSITGHKGSFTPLADRLSPRYRIFSLDLRGRGASDKPTDGYGFAYHAQDILAFADAIGIQSFVLVGHSFGATTGVYTASIRPERVRALVLMDGGPDPKGETLRSMYPGIRRLDEEYPSVEEYLAAQRSVSYYKPWTAALERYLREDVEVQVNGSVRSRSSTAAIERDLDLHFWYSMCNHFPNVRCPALLLRPLEGLNGTSGHAYSDEEALNAVEHFANCKHVKVKGGNHYTFLLQDDPPVLPFIEEFLDRVLAEPVSERA